MPICTRSSLAGDGPANGQRLPKFRLHVVVFGVGERSRCIEHLGEERTGGHGENHIEDVTIGQTRLAEPGDVLFAD